MLSMSGPPRRRHIPITLPPTATPTLAAILTLCLAAASPAGAQVVISSQGRGSVVVNSEALDALGPAPTVPQLLDPSLMPNRASGLRPPGSLAAPGAVPRSRVYPLPPAATASAAAPAPRSGLAPMTAAPTSRLAALPPASTTSTTSPTVTSPPAPPPMPRASAPTPPSPSEMRTTRAPMTASAPPPPPALDTPPPPRTQATPTPSPPPIAATPPMPAAPPPPPAPLAAATPPPSAPAPNAAPPQVAVAATPGVLSRVLFSSGSADLTEAGRRDLQQLAGRLGREGESRIQLLAYAEGTPESESQARRLSLSRALAVRSFLIEQGIRSTRVNVQALGIKTAGGPADRVDAMAVGP